MRYVYNFINKEIMREIYEVKDIIYKKLNDFDALYRLRIFLARHTFLRYGFKVDFTSRMIIPNGKNITYMNKYISFKEYRINFFKKSSGTFQYISYINIFNVITWIFLAIFSVICSK